MTPHLIIFDADSTLRKCTVPGQPCPNKPGEWELMPNVRETLAKYDWSETVLGIASNQGGVGLGFLSIQDAYQMLCDLVVEATGRFPPQGCIQVCPHSPDAGCSCRKPKPEMLFRIMRFWGAHPSETLMVGDREDDRLAAEAAGCAFQWAKDFFGWGKA